MVVFLDGRGCHGNMVGKKWGLDCREVGSETRMLIWIPIMWRWQVSVSAGGVMMSDWGGGSVQSQCSQKKSERRGWGGKPFYHIHQTHTHTHTHKFNKQIDWGQSAFHGFKTIIDQSLTEWIWLSVTSKSDVHSNSTEIDCVYFFCFGFF